MTRAGEAGRAGHAGQAGHAERVGQAGRAAAAGRAQQARRALWHLNAVIVVATAATMIPLRAAEPTAAELVQSLQRKYDAIHDFSADFVHNYRSGALRKQLTE